jgi:hypothetical protein
MIAPKTLLNTPLTPRTLLRRLRNYLLTRCFLCSLQLFIRPIAPVSTTAPKPQYTKPNIPILILLTRLALVPCNPTLNTMLLLTRLAPKAPCIWRMDLACGTSASCTPAPIWYGFEVGFCVQLVVTMQNQYSIISLKNECYSLTGETPPLMQKRAHRRIAFALNTRGM